MNEFEGLEYNICEVPGKLLSLRRFYKNYSPINIQMLKGVYKKEQELYNYLSSFISEKKNLL